MKIRLSILALLVGLLAALAYAQSSIKVCKAPLSGGGTVLYSADFEDNSYSTWDYVNTGDPGFAINTNMTYVRPGGGTRSSGVHYYFAGAPFGSTDSQDLAMIKNLNGVQGLEEWYIRGYMYLKTPAGTQNILSRKLMFFSDDNGSEGYNWSIYVYAWYNGVGTNSLNFGSNTNTYVPAFAYGEASGGSPLATLSYDTWYCLEVHVKLDTGGLSNGIIQMWLDGTKVLDVTRAIRGNFTTGGSWFNIGKQAARANFDLVDEWRYWDDIKISTGYVGP